MAKSDTWVVRRARGCFLALAVTSVAACVGPADPMAPAGKSFGERVQALSTHLAPRALAEDGVRRVAYLANHLEGLPASELRRVPALASTGEAALDGLGRSMVRLTTSGARIARLIGIDTPPLPEPSDADRSTNPFVEPEKTGFLARVMNRIGF